MRLSSESFENRQRLPAEFAAGQRSAEGVGFGPNRNPQLRWGDVPAGTQSFALLCIDPDVPTVKEMVGAPGVEIPVEQPRCDFSHWVMVDLPADLREIAAGSCSDGVVPHGKADPRGPAGSRQGLNDYTGWFAGNAEMAGDWRGYDGPFPPPNDLRAHRYFFRLFALDLARLDLPERFGAAEALRAMHGHVLAEAAIHAV
jgi:Raf kinase inhibitor-like YbhB/YbcL family protein